MNNEQLAVKKEQLTVSREQGAGIRDYLLPSSQAGSRVVV